MAQTNIAKTTQSRVFMTMSKSSPAVAPVFQDCLVVGGVTQNFGDREAIYCQDPYKIGAFKQVAVTESPTEPAESSLNGRLSYTTRSNLIRAAREKAPVDLHVHLGAVGSNPSVFGNYTMKIIFQGSRFSSLDIDELGSHDEDTPIGHSVDFVCDDWYQVVPLSFSERGAAVATKEAVAAHLYYNGELTKPPKERVLALAATVTGAGSPSTKPDLLYSLDSGTNWYASDITTAGASDNATGVAVIGEYVVVMCGASDEIHYTTVASLDGVNEPTWTKVTTGLVANKGPLAVHSLGAVAFFAGEGGYVYKTSNIASGVTVLDAGEATTENLNDIHAIDETTILAAGANNIVIRSVDGENFSAITGPAVGVALNTIWGLTKDIFLVGTAGGELYYTTNGGVSWTAKSFSGSGSGAVEDIAFATDMVGFMSHTLSDVGRVFMTTDAGYSWSQVPAAGLAAITDKIDEVAILRGEPNLVLLAGLDNTGALGTLIVGEPSA